ncbi:MAG TPA: glycosyltransferase family 4 protein [Thermoplasmata archaeon]
MGELHSLCVNSQTPLLRFLLPPDELAARFWGDSGPISLDTFTEGVEYIPTAGGVTQVVRPLLMSMLETGAIDQAHWLSIAPTARFRVKDGRISMHGVLLDPESLGAYTVAKERLWNTLHGLSHAPMEPSDFQAFARYNWECTRAMFRLAGEVDLFYVHDFQQLQTGAMIGLAAPVVLQWHIPLLLERLSPIHRRFILKGLESFDAVIVSCRRDLEALLAAGYHGRASQVYPVLDPGRLAPAGEAARSGIDARFGTSADDRIVLCVGRMDPMKGQDVLLRAFRKIVPDHPNARLVLVGNGSFTSSSSGGLGHSKADDWRRHLLELVKSLGIEAQTRFVGFLSEEELRAAYERAEVVVLPSSREGFGLVVPEAWMFSTPVIVSDGAGVSELIVNGQNGMTFPSGDPDALVDRLSRMMADPSMRSEMGRRGKETAPVCFVENRLPDVLRILRETHRTYQ